MLCCSHEAKTGIKPMVEIECRGEPYVRPRTKTGIEPMVENIYKSVAFGHRFDNGFCSKANIKFAPTFIFGHRLKKYTRTALSPINWIRPQAIWQKAAKAKSLFPCPKRKDSTMLFARLCHSSVFRVSNAIQAVNRGSCISC